MFQNYLECLKEAHDRFLSYIFQGHKFPKMEQNPLHSQDLNHGVPPFFNDILDELLDDTHAIYAEEYDMEQMKLEGIDASAVSLPAAIEEQQPQNSNEAANLPVRNQADSMHKLWQSKKMMQGTG